MSSAYIPLIYVLAFVAVVVLAQTLAGVFFAVNDRSQKVNRRLTLLESGLNHDEVYAALVRKAVAPTLGGARLRRLHDRVETYCRQAGLQVSPTRLLIITAGIAGALWLLGLTVIGATGNGLFLNGLPSLLGACGLSVVGVWFWATGKRNQRLKKIENQLPLALDVVNRAIRAGHPVISAVGLAASEMGDPLGSEFGLIVDETTYGAEFKEALVNFARRTGSPDAHYFAVCVGIQSETGGNLAEILEGLATLIRGRNTLSKRVVALASEGKASAYLLSAIPPALASFELLINPRIYSDKFSDPIFWPTVAVVISTYLLGWVMINRIINFKY
jgi:tight adherence protein B